MWGINGPNSCLWGPFILDQSLTGVETTRQIIGCFTQCTRRRSVGRCGWYGGRTHSCRYHLTGYWMDMVIFRCDRRVCGFPVVSLVAASVVMMTLMTFAFRGIRNKKVKLTQPLIPNRMPMDQQVGHLNGSQTYGNFSTECCWKIKLQKQYSLGKIGTNWKVKLTQPLIPIQRPAGVSTGKAFQWEPKS